MSETIVPAIQPEIRPEDFARLRELMAQLRKIRRRGKNTFRLSTNTLQEVTAILSEVFTLSARYGLPSRHQ